MIRTYYFFQVADQPRIDRPELGLQTPPFLPCHEPTTGSHFVAFSLLFSIFITSRTTLSAIRS
jgi:hypothetical protein